MKILKKIFFNSKNKKKSNIKKIAKKNLTKKQLKNIKKIKDKNEKQEILKYLLTSKLYLRYLDLEKQTQNLKDKDSVFINLKLITIPGKIKLFQAGFEKDFNRIDALLNEIEKEIKNV